MTTRGRAGDKGRIYTGIGVSPGVVMGPAYVMAPESLAVSDVEISQAEIDSEIVKFEKALIETRRQIRRIQEGIGHRAGGSYDAAILDAHLMVLDDRSFIEDVLKQIRDHRRNAAYGVKTVAERYAEMLASLEDEYLRERVVDVRDVARRILRNLNGEKTASLADLIQKHIIVAQDLAPSETASLRKDMVIGFVTDLGSPTSHTAVLARSLEIPAVVGLHDLCLRVQSGDQILIDGNKGIVIHNPTDEQLEKYGKVAEARRDIERSLRSLKDLPAETRDGHRITLSANAESKEEIEAVIEHGAEGIGLFRSEYIFLTRNRMVEEDEQAEIYMQVATRLAPAPVIVRTLDIGGDKYFQDGSVAREANPFLGCRSIRLSLQNPDVFKKQLRAILRANVSGNVKIMYPMISNAVEVIKANQLLDEARRELLAEGVKFVPDIDVGVMIEIPGAALTADVIAEHVKFFSIGTNDLIQYTLAVDRGNERVAYLYEPTHPAIVRLIRHTVEAGHRKGLWVGVCGEMAGDPLMAPLLLGLGVDELSVAPLAVPLVKEMVRSIAIAEAREMASKALQSRSAVEVLTLCRKLAADAAPQIMKLI